MDCMGSAVGLANVWALSYQLGANKGLAFLLAYLLFSLIFGRVGLSVENAIGRKYKSNPMVVHEELLKVVNKEISTTAPRNSSLFPSLSPLLYSHALLYFFLILNKAVLAVFF